MTTRAVAATGSLLIAAAVVIIALSPARHAPDYARTPVLFVHGHGLSPEYWAEMIEYLVGLGYPPDYLLAVDIRPRRLSNPAAARQFIEPAVARLLEGAAAAAVAAKPGGRAPERVNVVAHSMGAVSSRWFAARIAPERVRTWISIAGANYGTDALCGHRDEGAMELCPAFAASAAESSVQVHLNGTRGSPIDATPYGIGTDPENIDSIPWDAERNIVYYTIRQEPDEWIVPAVSAEIGGAGGVRVNLPVELRIDETSTGNFLLRDNDVHDLLPRNETVIRAVAAMLAARDADS